MDARVHSPRSMSLSDVLLGKRIPTDEETAESVTAATGVPVLGLDALASAAYGPEALLTVLLPLGLTALHGMVVLVPLLALVLLLLFVSYRQTIPAYPGGGGAYTVAKENLGARPSLIAAAALALDYILNVAVAIAAGVGALASAIPALLPHTLALCLGLLAMLTIVNLRGMRETGVAFTIPTYAFIFCMLAAIGLGVARMVTEGAHPRPLAPLPVPHATEAATMWILVRAFANGCTALTGVEAISNGVPMFREPKVPRAQRTLAIIVGVLALLLAGETVVCWAYHVTATEPGRAGYQSLLSLMIGAVAGRGVFYHVAMVSIVGVLMLSANTSFAGFPKLCQVVAKDRYLPEPFVHRGRRLAYSTGILVLAAMSAILLIAFGGITDALIPLFAVGALAAFTMSQLGMVGHWRRLGNRRPLVLNALGAAATGITLVVVLVAKLTEGAWISVLIVVAIYTLLRRVRGHYDAIAEATCTTMPLEVGPVTPPVVIVPLRRWDLLALKALRLARQLGGHVLAVQVLTRDREIEDLAPRWRELAGGITLETIRSEYRELQEPLLAYVQRIAAAYPNSQVVVVIPELVEARWYQFALHAHTAAMLRRALLHKGGPQVVVLSAPWHLRETRRERRLARARRPAPG
jgi:amino acid transporter